MRFRMGWVIAAVAASAVSACTSSGDAKTAKSDRGWFEARPLVMPGQRATTVHADPLGSLKLPTNEDAYNNLSRAQQADLANALHGVDCAHPPQLPRNADRVVCDADSDVFLLGAPLFTGDDVTHAARRAPSPGIAGWQVSLSLSSSAAETMSRWTSRHHVNAVSGAFNDVQISSKPPCGPITTTPCADFTAFISDSVVVTVPVWMATIQNTVVIDGEFNEAFATRLAHRLTD